MAHPDRPRGTRSNVRNQNARNQDASTLRKTAAVVAAAVAFALVFAGVDFLFGKAVAERFPAPAQAAVWSTIAMFVAGTVALAVAAQVWWLIRRSR